VRYPQHPRELAFEAFPDELDDVAIESRIISAACAAERRTRSDV
jgi:hypothetical protein